MKNVTFTRCVDSRDPDVIQGWLSGKTVESTEICHGCHSMMVVVTVSEDFTQQEQDDLTADAAARFMLVEFSA